MVSLAQRIEEKGRVLGRQEGWQEGRQEGRQEGWHEHSLATAKRLLAEKVELVLIAKVTELPLSVIRTLQLEKMI